jgi:hypothetical protein
MREAGPVRGGTHLRGFRVGSQSYRQLLSERTANGEAIQPEPGGSRKG